MRRRIPRTTDDPNLTPMQDAIEAPDRILPVEAPELRGQSIGTRDEARKTRGSADGNRGPRAMTLAGYETPLDGGEGVFVWDATSTAADDEGTTTLMVVGVAVGRWVRARLYPAQTAAVLAIRYLTAGTSVAATAGTRRAWARLWGGGAGGGGVAGAPAGAVNIGGGGGAGSPAEFWTTTIPANWTYAIGAAGAAGSNVGGAGGNGGNTTFSDGVTTVTAPGGTGAAGDNTGGAAAHVNNGGPGGAVSTNGTVNGTGADGGHAVHLAAAQAYSGAGASTSMADGGASVFGASFAGNAGRAPGAGGSGAIDKGTGVGRAGGVGGLGGIILVEFG